MPGLLFAFQEGNVLYPLSPFPTLLVTLEAVPVGGTHGLLCPLDFSWVWPNEVPEGIRVCRWLSPCGVAKG